MKKLFTVFALVVAANFAYGQEVLDPLYIDTSELPKTTISWTQSQNLAITNNYLIVIDNKVSTLSEFQQLQLNDVETSSVSTSASALYGNKAAGGVIVVNTKRGGGEGKRIDYQFSYGQ